MTPSVHKMAAMFLIKAQSVDPVERLNCAVIVQHLMTTLCMTQPQVIEHIKQLAKGKQ